MIKINPFFSLISFFLFSISFSQEIAGSIYYDKLPLPDVNIKIEGTQIGTKSNKNGEFKISARKGDILIFTYVGMKTERIKIKDFNDLKINMQVSVSELEGIELKGIDKQMIESRIIITRFGEIDMDKTEGAKEVIFPLIDAGKNVNLNLSSVQYMDSSGISVLIESHQKALEKGTKLVIKDVSKSVLKVIMMAKLEQILNLE